MSKAKLELLFDSRVRIKILKFLFRNMDLRFTPKLLAEHTQEDISTVKAELKRLYEVDLLRMK